MLRMTGVKLEKIINIDMYLFIEKGLRRGISYIVKRYAKAYKIVILQNGHYTYRTWI